MVDEESKEERAERALELVKLSGKNFAEAKRTLRRAVTCAANMSLALIASDSLKKMNATIVKRAVLSSRELADCRPLLVEALSLTYRNIHSGMNLS